MIYLDHSATSPIERSTLEAMWPYFTEHFGNASSQHEIGKNAASALSAARQVVAEIFDCQPNEIIFTSGGTESINAAIKGAALANPKGRHVVTTPIEHEAIINTCRYLETFHNFKISFVNVNKYGIVDTDHLQQLVDNNTTLVSVQTANNEVGTIQNIELISRICSSNKTLFHTDAVQAAGLIPAAQFVSHADLASVSAHKFGGPKGIGLLIKRNNIFLEPLLHGGGQERNLRSGTSNVVGAVGLAAALHTATERITDTVRNIKNLRDSLITGVQKNIPTAVLTGHPETRLAHHASFCFPGRSGESLLLDLQSRGIACSSGSACAADSQEPSYVLLAMGIDALVAETAIRFTLSNTNTQDEIDTTIRELTRIIQQPITGQQEN